jgi:hypothetical protein
MQEGDVMDDFDTEIRRLADWLSDPGNAEPCAGFPTDAPDLGSGPGIYAWLGDDTANELVADRLRALCKGPLFLARTDRPMNKSILRDLRNTKASTLRRSLAALLWDELALSCPAHNTIDAAGDERLTEWMHAHLSVAVVPFRDVSNVPRIEADLLDNLDPPLNLNRGLCRTPGRKRLRALRSRNLGVTSDEAEWARQLLALHAAKLSDSDVVIPITRATGKGSRRSRAFRESCWTPADANGGA